MRSRHAFAGILVPLLCLITVSAQPPIQIPTLIVDTRVTAPATFENAMIERLYRLLFERLEGLINPLLWDPNGISLVINEIFGFSTNANLLTEMRNAAIRFRDTMRQIQNRDPIRVKIPEYGRYGRGCQGIFSSRNNVLAYARLTERKITLCPIMGDYDIPFQMPHPETSLFETFAHEMAHVGLQQGHFFIRDGPQYWTVNKIREIARIIPGQARPNGVSWWTWKMKVKQRTIMWDAYVWQFLLTYSQSDWKFYNPYNQFYLQANGQQSPNLIGATAFLPRYPVTPNNDLLLPYPEPRINLGALTVGLVAGGANPAPVFVVQSQGTDSFELFEATTNTFLCANPPGPPAALVAPVNAFCGDVSWKGIFDAHHVPADWLFYGRVFLNRQDVTAGTPFNDKFQLINYWRRHLGLQNSAGQNLVHDATTNQVTFANGPSTVFEISSSKCPSRFSTRLCIRVKVQGANDYLHYQNNAWRLVTQANQNDAPLWLFTRFRVEPPP